MTTTTEAFILILGVEVQEVDGLDGRCAMWHEPERVVRLCTHLCSRCRENALTDLLGRLDIDDVPTTTGGGGR